MSEQPQGPGWWQASDGKYYPPESAQPTQQMTPAAPVEPTASPSTPFWKRWWFWVLAVLLVVLIVILASGGGDTDDTASPTAQPTATETATTTASPTAEPTDEPTQTESPDAGGNPYDEAFGTFEPLSEQGSGASVVELPAGATSGVVTATHQGAANFVITALDEGNQPTGDLLVNTIGAYSGTTAYGLSSLGDAVRLQIDADGAWTIDIVPVSQAPALSLPAQDSGDRVVLYDGAAATWTLTHDGQANFVVVQYPAGDGLADLPNLMVNEIGEYSGSVPVVAGPSVVTINADGSWTIAEG